MTGLVILLRAFLRHVGDASCSALTRPYTSPCNTLERASGSASVYIVVAIALRRVRDPKMSSAFPRYFEKPLPSAGGRVREGTFAGRGVGMRAGSRGFRRTTRCCLGPSSRALGRDPESSPTARGTTRPAGRRLDLAEALTSLLSTLDATVQSSGRVWRQHAIVSRDGARSLVSLTIEHVLPTFIFFVAKP